MTGNSPSRQLMRFFHGTCHMRMSFQFLNLDEFGWLRSGSLKSLLILKTSRNRQRKALRLNMDLSQEWLLEIELEKMIYHQHVSLSKHAFLSHLKGDGHQSIHSFQDTVRFFLTFWHHLSPCNMWLFATHHRSQRKGGVIIHPSNPKGCFQLVMGLPPIL